MWRHVRTIFFNDVYLIHCPICTYADSTLYSILKSFGRNHEEEEEKYRLPDLGQVSQNFTIEITIILKWRHVFFCFILTTIPAVTPLGTIAHLLL